MGMFSLKLIFGFLQCYERVLCSTHGEIDFTRKINHENIFYGKAGTDGKVEILDMKLFIPRVIIESEF